MSFAKLGVAALAAAVVALAATRALAQGAGTEEAPPPADASVETLAPEAEADASAPDPAPPPPAPPPEDAGAPDADVEAVDPTRPPVGRAAPPTEAATRSDGAVRAGLEVFAEYAYRRTNGPGDSTTWFHVFDVPRVHGAIEGRWEKARGRVLVEGVRSASEGALIGVAGDSFVLRLREAYGAYRPIEAVEISAGIVPTLTVPELDGTWMMRAVAPSGIEANGLGTPADLGAKARVDAPGGWGWAGVAMTNGEGYTSRELNRGKNLEGALELHPLPKGALLPLGIFVSYVDGSSGTVSARANRLTSGLVWQGGVVRAGAVFTYAWGVGQDGLRRSALGSGFVRAEPIRNVLAAARVDHVVRDLRLEPTDAITTLWLALGYRLAAPVEAFLAFSKNLPTSRAEDALPGIDQWSLRAVGRVVF